MNVAVGVMQIVGYGLGGLLLLAFTTSQLFLSASASSLLPLLLCLAACPARNHAKQMIEERWQQGDWAWLQKNL